MKRGITFLTVLLSSFSIASAENTINNTCTINQNLIEKGINSNEKLYDYLLNELKFGGNPYLDDIKDLYNLLDCFNKDNTEYEELVNLFLEYILYSLKFMAQIGEMYDGRFIGSESTIKAEGNINYFLEKYATDNLNYGYYYGIYNSYFGLAYYTLGEKNQAFLKLKEYWKYRNIKFAYENIYGESEFEIWIDPKTGFKWQLNPSKNLFELKSFTYAYNKIPQLINSNEKRPEWDGQEYDVKVGTIENYPAYEYCRNLGENWRLPNNYELSTLVNYSKNTPASNHPNILSDEYWNTDGRKIDFKSGSWSHSQTPKHLVICINEAEEKQLASKKFSDEVYLIGRIDGFKDETTGKYWQELIYIDSNKWRKISCPTGWKRPTINELFELYSAEKNRHGVYSAHKNIGGEYWSSTTYSGDDNYAYTIDFNWYGFPQVLLKKKDETTDLICVSD